VDGIRTDDPPGWLVMRRELVVQALRLPDVFTVDDPRFSTGRVLGPNMLSLDGSEHTRHRAPFASSFKSLGDREALQQTIESVSTRLVASIRGDGHADLQRAVAAPLAAEVMLAALGLDGVDVGELLGWYAAIVDSVTTVSLGGDPHRAGAEAMAALGGAVRASVDRSALLAAAAGGLSQDEVVSNVAVLLFGGLETSEAMTANALAHVLGNGELVARLQADPAIVPVAVEESVRLEPAAARLDRYAARDHQLGSFEIGAGDHVMLSLRDANRDPAVFDDPDTFRLDRTTTSKNLSFAQGPHACLATHVAKAETTAALRAVLDLPDIALAGKTEIEGVIFRKPNTVDATWTV
jgi:cytochrome P450